MVSSKLIPTARFKKVLMGFKQPTLLANARNMEIVLGRVQCQEVCLQNV